MADRRARVDALVLEHTGRPSSALRVIPTDAGPVLFLTAALPGHPSLDAAHRLASELEEQLRAEQPDFAEVVVHTEPG